MTQRKELVSFVFPVHNEEGNIEELYRQVKENCVVAGVGYEMIFIDDGSTDRTLDIIKGLKAKDAGVRFLSLSRSFGHQNAIFAGMSKATGDAVITMDGDLQHPPSLIPEMVKLWRSGIEVVYTKKAKTDLPMLKYAIIKYSYWFISKISGLKLGFGQSDFRLLDKKVLKIIVDMPEYHKFLRGQTEWVGFKQHGLSYDVAKRHSGEAKYTYGKLVGLAMNGIFAFSRYPLHVIMMMGLTIAAVCFIYIAFVIFVWMLKILGIVHIPMPPGWTTIIMSVFFLGSLQLVSIGILGEYIGRVYDQSKGRPVFIVREESN
jgi:glycosyltransferase involved in cell wall biosynthesis